MNFEIKLSTKLVELTEQTKLVRKISKLLFQYFPHYFRRSQC